MEQAGHPQHAVTPAGNVKTFLLFLLQSQPAWGGSDMLHPPWFYGETEKEILDDVRPATRHVCKKQFPQKDTSDAESVTIKPNKTALWCILFPEETQSHLAVFKSVMCKNTL